MTVLTKGQLKNQNDRWTPVGDTFLLAVAVGNFNLDSCIQHGLKLTVGDLVLIYEQFGGWFRGCLLRDKRQVGIFPASHVAMKDIQIINVGNEDVVQPLEPPVAQEVTCTVREWHEQAKKHFLNASKDFDTIRERMYELISMRYQVLSKTLPVDELKELTQRITSTIDQGNALLDTDLVLRDENGNILQTAHSSTIRVFRAQETALKKLRQMILNIGDRNSILSVSSDDSKNSNSAQLNQTSHALHVSIENSIIKIGEDADLLFSLFDGGDILTPITENYIVRLSKFGLVKDINLLNSLKVVFKDLGSRDLERSRILLVCQVIRIGSMEVKEVNDQTIRSNKLSPGKRTSDEIKRPHGIAMVDITEYVAEGSQHEFEMSLFMPFVPCGERDSLDSLLRKVSQFKPSDFKSLKSSGNGVFVQIQMNHGQSTCLSSTLSSLNATSIYSNARKMGFPDVIMPGDVRNDLYLTLNHGIFVSKASHAKNIEVTVRVYNSLGEIVHGVIFTGAGCPAMSEYRSVVYRHEERPKWMETIRISIPIEEYFNCHLVFLFKHRSSSESKDKSEKFFAMSFAKLKNSDKTAIKDNLHHLLVYKLDKKGDEELSNSTYLTLPSTRDEVDDVPKKGSLLGLSKGPRSAISTTSIPGLTLMSKDTFAISTIICSTKLTQNVNLLKLLELHSENYDDEEVKSRLIKFRDVEGDEKVKFLQDVLDTLFAVFIKDTENINSLVFNSLVDIICLVSDPKYQQFRQVLDTYIECNFSSSLAYIKIISALQLHIEGLINQCDSQSSRTSQRNSLCQLVQDSTSLNVMQSLEYLFKFIVRSRKLHSVLLVGSKVGGRIAFEKSMRSLLESFRQLISIDQGDVLKVQARCLRSFPLAIKDIMEVFEATELCSYLKYFIEHSPLDKLRLQKILYISDIIHIDCLFRRRDCRSILLPIIFPYLASFIATRDQIEHATEVIGDALELLHSVGATKDDITVLMNTILPVVVKFVSSCGKDDLCTGSLVAILFEVLRLMKNDCFTRYLECFRGRDIVDALMELLMVFKMLIQHPVYDKNSSDILLHINSVMLSSLKYLSRIIRDKFLIDFEYQLWNNFFHCAISYLTQPSLQLENFSSSKVKKITSIYGDMRKQAAIEVRSMWYQLDRHKILFVPGIVGLFVEMTLIPDVELRKETIPIFFDMMTCEYYSKVPDGIKGNFDDFSREMITQLDKLVEGGRGDEAYRELFKSILSDLWDNHESKESGLNFVKTVVRLLRRLLEYRRVVSPVYGNKDECMLVIVEILEFYEEINRQEMYLRYLYKLVQLHKECENWVEAGHSLMLHALLLDWSEETLATVLRSEAYPNFDSHRELKEQLYLDIIDYFDKGELWEDGIRLCKELACQYERELFDFARLAQLHHRIASFFEKIMTSYRPEPDYFRVYFYGNGFPQFIRGKTYIYRGEKYEQLVTFQNRLLNLYPKASIASTLTPEGENTEPDAQKMLITKVDPVMDQGKKESFASKLVSENILSYHRVNNIRHFTFSRPIRKSMRESVNEFAGISIERTTFTTAYPLPGILKQFPLLEPPKPVELSPIENAIETVQTANNEVRRLILQQLTEAKVPLNSLSSRLKGIVDPAVNGGISMYEEAFFKDSIIETMDEKDKGHVERLKNLIAEQVPLLEYGLLLHKVKASVEIKPLHEYLEKQFNSMKNTLELKYGRRALPPDIIIARDRFKKQNSELTVPPSYHSIRQKQGRSPSTPNTFTQFSNTANAMLNSTLGRKILYTKNREIGNDKRKLQTNSRFYTDTIDKDSSSPRILDQSISRSVNSLSASLNFASFCENSRNGHGQGDLIPLNQTLTTQRPLRPESEKKRPISGTSSRTLSQSHSSIQELRRGVSCSSVISTESNASCETVSMNPEPNNEAIRPMTAEVLTPSKKPPPLPAKSVRTTHTDLTTSDLETTFGSTLLKKPLPSLLDLQPTNNFKPKPRPRMTKVNEDVYKNINSIRRNDK